MIAKMNRHRATLRVYGKALEYNMFSQYVEHAWDCSGPGKWDENKNPNVKPDKRPSLPPKKP